MTDPNLLRVLQSQTRRKVGLIDHSVVAQGATAIQSRIAALKADGVGIAIVDAVSNDDLLRMGPALADLPLVTAGSGVAIALPANFGLQPSNQAAALPAASGLQAVVSGSCSVATNAQVAHFIASGRPALALQPLRMAAGDDVVREALDWARPHLANGPVLVYSTAEPDDVRSIRPSWAWSKPVRLSSKPWPPLRAAWWSWACGSWWLPVARPRAPACRRWALRRCALAARLTQGCLGAMRPARQRRRACIIALKSGNFGSTDFFTKAFTCLQG